MPSQNRSTETKKNLISHHSGPDWCHVCGERPKQLADVFYPDNAEFENFIGEHSNSSTGKYIRICRWCAAKIHQAAIENA